MAKSDSTTAAANGSTASKKKVTIKSKIEDKMARIGKGDAEGKKLADAIQAAAVRATIGGAKSWKEYMSLIVDGDPALLAKLKPLPADPENKKVFKRNLALSYLIGNGNCGATSTTGLIYGVGDELDKPMPTS